MDEPTRGPGAPRGMRLLRWLARLLVRGPAAPVLLAEFDELAERDGERGMSHGRIRRRYLANAMGSASAVWKEAVRHGCGASLLDARLGLRLVRKTPGLTAASVLALSIGIPVGLAPWHLAGIAEADLPVLGGDRIRALRLWSPEEHSAVPSTLGLFHSLQVGPSTMKEVAAVRVGRFNLGSSRGGSALVDGGEVTEATFRILRVSALLGRTLLSDDFLPEAPAVAVLGEPVWRARFAGDSSVVGQDVWIGGVPHTVVGVMPAGFRFPRTQDVWMPLRPALRADGEPPELEVHIFGRLADGATTEAARAEFEALHAASAEAVSGRGRALQIQVTPFARAFSPRRYGRIAEEPDFFLLALSALAVLAVACVNVGMLVFARITGRGREIAVRTALGASRRRIVGQIAVETGVMATVAVGVGLLLLSQLPPLLTSARAPGLVQTLGPISERMPWWYDYGLRWTTVGLGLVLGAVSAILAGILPALRMTSGKVQQNVQRAEAGRSGSRFGGIPGLLIVADVAIVVAVLGFASATASAMVRAEVDQREMAIDARDYLAIRVALSTTPTSSVDPRAPEDERTRRAERHESLLRALAEDPGVRGVASGGVLPMHTHHRRGDVELDPGPRADDQPHYDVRSARVYPGFFFGLGVEVTLGRPFDLRDLDGESTTVIINEDMMTHAFGNANPIGRRIRFLGNPDSPGPWLEVVGVVPNLGMHGLGIEKRFGGIYLPMSAGEVSPLHIAVRTGGPPLEFIPRLRTLLNEVDSEVGLVSALPLDQVKEEDWYLLALLTLAGATLIAVLLALAVSSLYALTSYAVSQRTREIGIRAALGAGDLSLVAVVANRSIAQVATGVLLGMPVAWHVFRSIAVDGPVAILAALIPGVCLLLGVSLIACAGPTLRALRIEPTEALRS